MNFKHFAFMLCAVSLLAACKSGGNKTPGGFEYEILEQGSGDRTVESNDWVFFSAKLSTNEGEELNNFEEDDNLPSLQIPEELPVGPMSNPIVDLLKITKAKVGSTYRLILPIDSLPGARAEYPNLDYFQYNITVRKILNEEEFNKVQEAKQAEMAAKIEEKKARIPEIESLLKTTLADYKSGKLKTQSTDSGLKYYIIEEGDGEPAQSGQRVTAEYYGSLLNGDRFDDSFSRGQAFTFVPGQGQVIKGWDEGFALLPKGTKAFLFIPYDLAYGEAGSPPMIPGKSDLVFYVEINDIQK